MTPDRVLAAIALATCIVLLMRLLIGAKARARVDRALRRWLGAVRGLAAFARHRREAARAADEAIRRARDRATREGNVYTPKSFRKPPRDKMH
jgi:hypothetical protein